MNSIAENFSDINSRIANRARLIAVSKNQSSDKISEALAIGHRIFGENKVQEAYSHWKELRTEYQDLELHLIGPLQTNKAKDAVALFDYIQTLDRESLCNTLSKEQQKQGLKRRYFIQVNTGNEPQKAGVSVENVPALLAYARAGNLEVIGLMCIPPFEDDPAPHFEILKTLAAQNGLKELSMGMSSDFEKAINHGATYVRVGTALFGQR